MTRKHQAPWATLFFLVTALLLVDISLSVSADDVNPRVLFAQGFYLLQNEQPLKAVEKFEQGLVLDPDNAQAHYYLGEAYLATSRSDMARQHYERSLAIDAHSDVADDARKRLADLRL